MVSERENPVTKLELELRRGALVLAVLSQLKTMEYGYSLRQALAERGLSIEEGTLYPLLRRLESQGLLDSEWRIENSSPRRYYRLNATGKKVLAELTAIWKNLAGTISHFLEGHHK